MKIERKAMFVVLVVAAMIIGMAAEGRAATKVLFAPVVSDENGFDTGISISNTDTSPLPQTARVYVYFYGANAPSSRYVVASDESGAVLQPNHTVTFLLSEALHSLAVTGGFTGAIKVVITDIDDPSKVVGYVYHFIQGQSGSTAAYHIPLQEPEPLRRDTHTKFVAPVVPHGSGVLGCFLAGFAGAATHQVDGVIFNWRQYDSSGLEQNVLSSGTLSLKTDEFVLPTDQFQNVIQFSTSGDYETGSAVLQYCPSEDPNVDFNAGVVFAAMVQFAGWSDMTALPVINMDNYSSDNALYAYVDTTNSVNDSGLAITNVTGYYDDTPRAFSVTIQFFGTNAPTPNSITTPVISARATYQNLISTLAPGFKGYIKVKSPDPETRSQGLYL